MNRGVVIPEVSALLHNTIPFLLFYFLRVYSVNALTTDSQNFPIADNSSCAFLRLKNSREVILYENGVLSRSDYDTVNNNTLENSFLSVESNCLLEICGYGTNPPYTYGHCTPFAGSLSAPNNIFDRYSVVSSMGCACLNGSSRCQNTENTCNDTMPSTWRGNECAILFQEKNCSSCYFKQMVLNYGINFQCMNSFAVKSIVVRPGCKVEESTYGTLYADSKQFIVDREGIVTNMNPTYHKASENFTCSCNQSALAEMALYALATTLTVTEEATTSLSSPSPEETITAETNALIYILPITAGVLLLVGAVAIWIRRLIGRAKIKSHSNASKQTNLEIGQETLDNGKSECKREMKICSNDVSGEKEVVVVNQGKSKEEIMVELKKYIEYMIESSKQAEEAHLVKAPSQRHSSLAEQFSVVCHPTFELSRDCFTIGELLGSGHFGNVYKGMIRQQLDGLPEHVAVKTLKPPAQEEIIASFLREIRIFQCVGSHKNVVKFVGACCHNGELFILTEFCGKGSLKTYVTEVIRPKIMPEVYMNPHDPPPSCKADDGYIDSGVLDGSDESDEDEDKNINLGSEDLFQLLQWAEQIASGMEFLNNNKIIHVDLAIRNILLLDDLTVQICDFGLSRKCLDEKNYAQSLISGNFPVNSIAPECTRMSKQEKGRISVYIDIWAYGCVLWELYTLGERPYADMNPLGIAQMLGRRERLRKPPLAPESVYKKLLHCWDEVPENRPSFTHLRDYFSDLKNTV